MLTTDGRRTINAGGYHPFKLPWSLRPRGTKDNYKSWYKVWENSSLFSFWYQNICDLDLDLHVQISWSMLCCILSNDSALFSNQAMAFWSYSVNLYKTWYILRINSTLFQMFIGSCDFLDLDLYIWIFQSALSCASLNYILLFSHSVQI